MEATYINTGHPDFLNGHRAMAIVNERFNSAKPVPVDPKTGKPLPQQQQTSQTLDNNENGGFFGSFFAAKNKKRMAAMEAPPQVLKASGTLSERESIETEVISECLYVCVLTVELLIQSYFNIVKRTMIDMVPKSIMLKLVMFTKDEMQRELLENLYKVDVLDELLKESDFTIQRRKECQRMVESLKLASDIVSAV